MKLSLVKITIILTIVAVAITFATAQSDWEQFQKNETKIGMSDAVAIVSSPTTTWSATLNDFYAAPIAQGGFVYASNRGGLHKYYYNGTKPNGWPATAVNTLYGSPAYGDGTERIFAYGASRTIKGVNESNSSDVWSATPPVAAHEFMSEITYAINKSGTKSIYFGDGQYGNHFYCYDVGGDDFGLRWNYTPAGGQFWAGASVIGDYVLFGNESAYVTCLHESNGTYVDSIYIGTGQNQPHIRSSISWNATNATYGHIFFTNCQGFSGGSGYVWKVGFNTTTGQFNDADKTHSDTIYRTTTTPAVYNGRVYAGDYPTFSGGYVYCLNESNLTDEIWNCFVGGAVQSSPALAKRDGHVYTYITRNYINGGVVCINDSGSIEWTDTTVGSYSMQGVAIAENETGTWIFATSQGGKRLAGHWAGARVTKSDLNVTVINNDTIYSGIYNIIKATVKNGGNGNTGEFNVTLYDGSAVVDTETVTSLDAGDSTTVKFLWTPASATIYTLNITADSDDVLDEWDETNNSKTKSVTASTIPQTDLVVSEVNDEDLFNDTDNVVFAVIENRGANASAFNVSLKVNGNENDRVFVPTLFFRDSQLVTFGWKPTSTGSKQINITVDCDGEVTESKENNNMTGKTIEVITPTVVNVNSGSSIQSAITSASNNTIILVNNGVFNETVTIPASKSSIRLIANGTDVVICNNTGDIVTVKGTDCWVTGFAINSTWDGSSYANHPGASINVTSKWNVIADNYIYNSSGGIKLYGSDNLIDNNTVGDSSEGRACLNLMAISGDCNAIVNNTFDGDTGNGWILGGTYTAAGMTETDATNNTVHSNRFTVTGVGGWSCGDLVFGGDPNLIFNNRINDNDADKVKLGKLNWYNVTKIERENIMEGAYLGGNYWSSYTGADANNDDIGDTAHHADQLPLMPKKYDFSDSSLDNVDRWVFKKEVSANSPDNNGVPSDVFSSYANIRTDDGTMESDETGTEDYYSAHRFNFTIAEYTSNIAKLNVMWNGIGKHEFQNAEMGANLSIWNGTGYQLLQEGASTEDEVNLTGDVTSDISNYINTNNVTVLVEQKSAQRGTGRGAKNSWIETDYVKVYVYTYS